MLKIVKNRAPEAITLTGDEIDKIPQNSLDIILALGCLYMNDLDTQESILQKFYNLLKENGTIYATYRAPNDSLNKNGVGVNYGISINFCNIDTIEKLFNNCGFKLTDAILRTHNNLIKNEVTAFYTVIFEKTQRI